MRAVTFTGLGGPELLNIAEVPIPNLKPNQIFIKNYATALNRADLLQRRGMHPPPKGASEILGLECAGEVAETAEGFQAGQRVMALLSGGGYAEYVAVHKDHVLPVPPNMPLTEAAGIPEAWITAYMVLFYLGGAKEGEKALIHAGASGVGSALIQLARLKGVVPYATSRTPEKLSFIRELGGIPLSSEEFQTQMTEVGGADVICDCVGADYFNKNAESLNLDGRIVVYGLMGGSKFEMDYRKVFSKRATMHFTTLRSRSDEYKAKVIAEMKKDGIVQAFETGEIKPMVDQVFPMENVREAHEQMESNKNLGKIILKIRD